VAAGAIPERDDVFEFTGEEVRSLAQGTCPYPEGLAAVRAERRRLRAEAATVPPPSLFVLRAGEVLAGADGPRAPARPPGASPHRLVGLPVSRGLVRGRARVVRDPLHETLAPGEILVAESTDPGWTPLVFLAGGLVLERGGMLSHGAIVAREVGIPGLVQVEGACARIASGDELLLDANAGTVLVEPSHG
jgi:pyruvate,water dikinase